MLKEIFRRFIRYKPFIRLSAILMLTLILGGCWDKVEMENRAYCLTLGIDLARTLTDGANGFEISAAIPNTSSFGGRDGEDASVNLILTAENETVPGALRDIDARSNLKLYLGHTKLIVFSEEILSDPVLFEEAVASLELDMEVSRKVLVMATDKKANEILNAKLEPQPLLGLFITNYYMNNQSGEALAFKQDLGSMIKELRETGNATMPRISVKEEKIEIDGACVIKESKFAGWLEKKYAKGFLWYKNQVSNMIMNISYDGRSYPVRISDGKMKASFEERDNGLACVIDIFADGRMANDGKEYGENELRQITDMCENKIRDDVTLTTGYLRNEVKADIMALSSRLRKQDRGLYDKHAANWPRTFENMDFEINANLALSNKS